MAVDGQTNSRGGEGEGRNIRAQLWLGWPHGHAVPWTRPYYQWGGSRGRGTAANREGPGGPRPADVWKLNGVDWGGRGR